MLFSFFTNNFSHSETKSGPSQIFLHLFEGSPLINVFPSSSISVTRMSFPNRVPSNLCRTVFIWA